MRCNECRTIAIPAIIFPNLASQIRTAFSSMACKHRLRSPGELLMTWSTSDVAVCCSSDSVSSAVRWLRSWSLTQLTQQPRVLDGDDGLSGEVSYKFNLLIGETAHLLAIKSDRAD